MPILSYIGVTEVSLPLDSSAVGIGLRVKRGSNGKYTVQDATARGEYVTLRDGAANDISGGAALGTPARVAMLTTVAVAVGDLAYSAAGGAVTNVSTSAVLIGKFAEATSGAAMAGVDLFPVA